MDAGVALLAAAEKVLAILRRKDVDAVVIGAVALAAFHYVRQTEDIDLGVNADPGTMRDLAEALRGAGFDVEWHEPDAADPLAGIIDVRGDFGLVQIISFFGRFPAVIDDALRESRITVREGSPLRIVPLPHLVALKLYAGGHKSKADIVELFARNPETDAGEIRELCRRYRLRGIDELIAEGESRRRKGTRMG